MGLLNKQALPKEKEKTMTVYYVNKGTNEITIGKPKQIFPHFLEDLLTSHHKKEKLKFKFYLRRGWKEI